MPADHLNPAPTGQTGTDREPAHQDPDPEPAVPVLDPVLESAVLAVLGGAAPEVAAAGTSIVAAELADAAERYRAAGRAALTRDAAGDGWLQIHLEFPHRHAAEHTVATVLGPTLRHAEAAGGLTSWWYIRKTPCWRLRLHASRHRNAALPPRVTDALDDLVARGLLTTWTIGIYEPETHAFGGPEAMAVAHRFFHADSAHVLEYITGGTSTALGRRELSLLLCATLLRGAGQDWHEQGDVWHRVVRMRPLHPGAAPEPMRGTTEKAHRLLDLDTGDPAMLAGPDAPLASARTWLGAAGDTGRALGALAGDGTLRRGLRDVLAHHVIFHWNRLGLTAAAQAVLAHAAATAVLHTGDGADRLMRGSG